MGNLFPTWPIEKQIEWSAHKEYRFREMASASMKESKVDGLDRLRLWVDRQEIPKAAVTNAPRLNAEAIIGGIGYDGWFDTLVIGEECERAKPDPCPYLVACKTLGVDVSECIVFEDSPSGARAGKAAGATVVGVLTSQKEETLLEAGCAMVIDSFDDPKLWKLLS